MVIRKECLQRLCSMAVGAVLCGCFGTAEAATVSIAEDGMTVVDGKRTFILGLYENPNDDGVLRTVAEAGFNLMSAGKNRKALERLEQCGLGAWLDTGINVDLGSDAEKRRHQLEEMVRKFADHDALWIWQGPDEVLWHCWHSATKWRGGTERKALTALIDDVDDPAEAEKLRQDLDRVDQLSAVGELRRSETLADEMWIRMGKTSPMAGIGVSNYERFGRSAPPDAQSTSSTRQPVSTKIWYCVPQTNCRHCC